MAGLAGCSALPSESGGGDEGNVSEPDTGGNGSVNEHDGGEPTENDTEGEPDPESENETEPEPEPEPEPALYDESDKEDMLLGVEAFPDGWKEVDLEENWDAAFSNESETIAVLLSIEVLPTVEDAKGSYDSAEESFQTNDYTLGDEAFWTDRPDNSRTIFRHSNAIGQAVGTRELSNGEVVPDSLRAQDAASKMFERWQSIADSGGE